MKKIAFLLLIICVTSCECFSAKKIASEDILNEELKTFNWNTVDVYPTFSVCDDFVTKAEKKQCFETTLLNHITSSLQEEVIVVSQDINETVILEFQILETGAITIKTMEISKKTALEIPNLKEIVVRGLNTLPSIFPAIKRNQQVKIEFQLPIVISVN